MREHRSRGGERQTDDSERMSQESRTESGPQEAAERPTQRAAKADHRSRGATPTEGRSAGPIQETHRQYIYIYIYNMYIYKYKYNIALWTQLITSDAIMIMQQ